MDIDDMFGAFNPNSEVGKKRKPEQTVKQLQDDIKNNTNDSEEEVDLVADADFDGGEAEDALLAKEGLEILEKIKN